MAKKRRYSYRRSGGKLGNIGKGIMAGAAVGAVNKFIPVNIAGADYIVSGYLLKNNLLIELGAITLGRNLIQSALGGGGMGGGSSFFD